MAYGISNFFVKPLLMLAVAIPVFASVPVSQAEAGSKKRAAIIAGAIIGGALVYHSHRKHRRHYRGHHRVRKHYRRHHGHHYRHGKRYHRGHHYRKRYFNPYHDRYTHGTILSPGNPRYY